MQSTPWKWCAAMHLCSETTTLRTFPLKGERVTNTHMCGPIIISETHQNRVRIPLYYSGHEFYEEDGYKIVVKLKKRRPKTSFPRNGYTSTAAL